MRRFPIEASDVSVSGLWLAPSAPAAALVLAHGAGAGMEHRSMSAIAEGLVKRGVATLRYNFPYMERGSRRPDAPPLAHAAVRAAVARAKEIAPDLPLFAGGKSFGGRMTSQAQAITPLGVRGLVFFAFPLHPAGKPATSRADHLFGIDAPMLFLQGTRDELADMTLLEGVVSNLGGHADLVEFEDADHVFHAPKKSGRSDEQVLDGILDRARDWMIAAAKR